MFAPIDFASALERPWHEQLLLAATVALAGRAVFSLLFGSASSAGKRRPEGTLPLLYNTLHVARHKHRYGDWLVDQVERAGGRGFWLRILGGPDIFVLTEPEQFEDVLKTHFDAFDKGEQMSANLRDLIGDGIFGVDGHKWVHQRKTASNLFSLRALRDSMAESVQKHALVLGSILQRASDTHQPLDLFKLLNRFTMEAFAEIGFGVELGALNTEEEHPFQAAFDGAQRILMTRFVRPGVVWRVLKLLNVGPEQELKQHLKTIDDTVLGIISKALENRNSHMHADREAVAGQKDIVSLFLDNVSHDGEGGGAFDPVFLRDIVVNFLIAGRDTTAQALSWFFYLLSEHPDEEKKIRAELWHKLPELCDGRLSTPSMEQTGELVYLEAALRETLRLHPSVPLNSRVANRDVVLSDGTLIQRGNKTSISSYVLARMTHVWGDDAKEFKPQRWVDPQSGKLAQVSAFKFPSFHAGPRTCLGMNLAMMEMKIVSAMVLSKFHLALVPGQNVTYDLSLTHPIKGELMMDVVSVLPSASA